jgi:hypothetical protein
VTEPYNPLNKRNLGKSVANALLQELPVPLANLERFEGAGIYALYYVGEFSSYKLLVAANSQEPCSLPIYVGKAVPSGSRKGGFGLGENPGKVLFNRLGEHLASIRAATNLDEKDFLCRYLVTDDIWIPLGEALLIDQFSPVWNRVLDGFGNHTPGTGRFEQQRSRWDTFHPGRSWAERCAPNATSLETIRGLVEAFLEGKQVPVRSTEESVIEDDD